MKTYNMNAGPSISVCMATYNGSRFIREQLESLGAQTVPPVELVVTDDGSTDDTLAIVADFAATAPFPVRCFRNAVRLGFRDNFLYAASLCQGDLISFCDQDDVWLSIKLDRCAREFRDPEVVLCVHSGELFGEGVSLDRQVPSYRRRSVLPPMSRYPRNCSHGFAMVFRQELMSIVDSRDRATIRPLPGTPLSHDEWVWFLGFCFGKVVTLPEALVRYRQHENNTIGAKASNWRIRLQSAFKQPQCSQRAKEEFGSAALLEYVTNQAPERWRPRALIAAQNFRRYAETNQLRASLYATKVRFIGRSAIFLQILLSGGYAIGDKEAWLGWRALFKDLVAGVLARHLVDEEI